MSLFIRIFGVLLMGKNCRADTMMATCPKFFTVAVTEGKGIVNCKLMAVLPFY